MTNHIKEQNNETGSKDYLTLSGHSGGDLRNYLSLENSNKNQFLDNNNNSVLKVRSYGGPVNNATREQIANKTGAQIISIQSDPADFVGNGLGGNGNILGAAWSTANVISLFEPGFKPNLKYFEEMRGYEALSDQEKKNTAKPEMFETIYSPHSIYVCGDKECNFNK